MMEKQIQNDILISIKNSDKFKVSVLRMLKSAIQNEAIEKKKTLDDNEILMVIKKQIKIRKDSLEEYLKYQRQDLADKTLKEIDILSVYLPEELSLEEINKELDLIFAEVNPTDMKSMGLLMKKAQEKMGTVADMKVVSQLIRERLSK